MSDLQSLIDSTDKQVYVCMASKDYFALRSLFDRLRKFNQLNPRDLILVERFNNSIIDIVDYVGESLFDHNEFVNHAVTD